MQPYLQHGSNNQICTFTDHPRKIQNQVPTNKLQSMHPPAFQHSSPAPSPPSSTLQIYTSSSTSALSSSPLWNLTAAALRASERERNRLRKGAKPPSSPAISARPDALAKTLATLELETSGRRRWFICRHCEGPAALYIYVCSTSLNSNVCSRYKRREREHERVVPLISVAYMYSVWRMRARDSSVQH